LLTHHEIENVCVRNFKFPSRVYSSTLGTVEVLVELIQLLHHAALRGGLLCKTPQNQQKEKGETKKEKGEENQ
jgi:hypothetical protein